MQITKKCDSDATRPGDKGDATKKTRFSESTKQKSDGDKAYCISKKARNAKFCQRCKGHGGAHKIHNTFKCAGMPKMALYNLPTLQNEKAIVNTVVVMQRKDTKALLSSR